VSSASNFGDDWATQYVLTFLTERTGRERSSIRPDDRIADLLIDSLDIVEFMMGVEDEFGIELPDPSRVEVETVDDAIAWVRRSRD
jgi:acyl carrier protein